jgi:hypothetical protein
VSYNTPKSDHWWDSYDNIVMLAYWMRERDHGVDDFVSMIEKPWKWTTEYEQAVADNAAEETEAERQAHLEREFKAGFDEGRPVEGDE